VALGILKKLGMKADAVANGAEAVRSLETIPYDLVLMDMQMPVMDGMEATRRIRDPQSAVLQHRIPIIAMTANALPGDREQCLRAGMDGYVTKPVSPKALAEAIERWLPQDGAAPPTPTPPSTPTPPEPEAATAEAAVSEATAEAEPAVFDRAGLLDRLMGDEELGQIVMREFLADIPRQIEALKGFLDCGDATAAFRQVHSIKGASANVGGEALRSVALEAETAGQAGGMDAIMTRVPSIEFQFARLTEAMHGSVGPERPQPGEPQ
jgi:CheY-like chemotaxis protein/HPt (histidine-containing phosphotransfer) domain-containing protein